MHCAPAQTPVRYRVLVSTDLGGDPDDTQSLFRLLHYSDILKIEGISSCCGPGSTPRASLIREWIQRVDMDHLRDRGHVDLMSEAELLACVRQGQTVPGPPGPDRATAASRQLVNRAMAGGPPEGLESEMGVVLGPCPNAPPDLG